MAFEGMNFGLARPTVALESPVDVAMKQLAMQQAQRQGQLQDLQIQGQTQAMQRATATRQAVASAGGDMEKMAKAAYDSGDWETGDKISTAAKAQAQAKVALQKTYLESNDLEQKQLKGMTQTAGSAAQAALSLKDPYERWQAWQQTLPQIARQVQPNPTDTPKMQQIKQSMIQQLQAESQSLMAMKNPDELDALLNKHVNDAKTHEDWMKEAESQRQAGKVVGVHADPQNNAFGVTANGTAVQIQSADGTPQKMRPPAPSMTTLMMSGANALTPDAKQMLVDKYIETGQLDSDLSARVPGLRNEIINAAAAQAKQNGGVNLAKNRIQFKTAQQAQDYFTKGKGADAFRQQETILHHADVFSGIADALNNGNIQAANKLGNAVGVQFGSDQATNYKIAGQILSAEVGKYLAGSQSTAEERKELADLIPSFSSPQQLKGGLSTLKALVEGQRQSWTVQRDAALKGQVPTYSSDKGGASPASQPTPRVMSLADAKATAAASGKTLDEVITAAAKKGWKVQ